MLVILFEDQVLINDARYMHYSRKRKRIVLKDDILYGQYYKENGDISHLQNFLHVQVIAKLFKSLHGTAIKKPVLSQKLQEIRQNY